MTAMEYRDMANEIRSLVPLLIHRQTAEDLRSLAAQYEKLASYSERAAVALPTSPHQPRLS